MKTQNTHHPLTALVIAIALLAWGPSVQADVHGAEPGNIVEVAQEAGQFNTLLAAAQAAGLADVLAGDGPLTVFAPTDEAFAALPEGTVENLLRPENRDQLVAILTHHVVPGALAGGDVATLSIVDALDGTSLLIGHQDGALTVDGATVVAADVEASNGIVHVIDQVILPKNLVETAQLAGQFDTLLAAATAAGLADALADPEAELTVFAPTDAAFAALPPGTVEDLLEPANRETLVAILSYHVVPGRLELRRHPAETLQGQSLDLQQSGEVRVDEARVVLADIKATNGVIHVIDRVLLPTLPPPPAETPVSRAMDLIERAIEHGAPLYNDGDAEACAAVYEVTANALLDGYSDALDDASRRRLTDALDEIRQEHHPRRQAWILRYALDDVYRNLRHME